MREYEYEEKSVRFRAWPSQVGHEVTPTGLGGEKKRHFWWIHFSYKNSRSFYQDRLGTNVGKAQKQDRFLLR